MVELAAAASRFLKSAEAVSNVGVNPDGGVVKQGGICGGWKLANFGEMAADEADEVDDGELLLSCLLSGDAETAVVVPIVVDATDPPSNRSTLSILLLALLFLVSGGVAVELGDFTSLLFIERS